MDKDLNPEGFCILCKKIILLNTYNGLCSQCWLNQIDEEVSGIKVTGIKGRYCHKCGEEYPTTSEKPFCEKCERELENFLKSLHLRVKEDKKEFHYIQIISKMSEEEVMKILRKSGLAREDIRKRILDNIDNRGLNKEKSALVHVGIQENHFDFDSFSVFTH